MTLVYGPMIGGEGSPIGKTYLSVSVQEDGVERALVPGTRIMVQIRKDGVLIARAGCNELSGGITLDDGVLRLASAETIDDDGVLQFASGPIHTQMFCGPEFATQDDWFFGFLADEPQWTVDGDTFTLTDGRTTMVLLDRSLAEPDLPLDNTVWTVESVVRGERLEHYVGVDPATLVLDGARVAGTTGRNLFTAIVTRDGDTLAFTQLAVGPATAGRPHPGFSHEYRTTRAADLEHAVLEGLRTPLTYSIESNHLRLRGPTRTTGLNLTAPRPEGSPYPTC